MSEKRKEELIEAVEAQLRNGEISEEEAWHKIAEIRAYWACYGIGYRS